MTAKEQRRQEAIARLREMVKPGDTLITVLRHVSSSGMYRAIDVYKFECDHGRVVRLWLSRLVADAIDTRFDEKRDAVGVTGVGMDMGFHIVHSLGYALFPSDYAWRCPGKSCPHNSHNNPPYPPKDGRRKHRGGGYTINHEWLG